jgi:hypothetical protein
LLVGAVYEGRKFGVGIMKRASAMKKERRNPENPEESSEERR